jgi:hypothetical protein
LLLRNVHSLWLVSILFGMEARSKGLSFVWRLVLFAVRMAAFWARVAIQIERYASLNLTGL